MIDLARKPNGGTSRSPGTPIMLGVEPTANLGARAGIHVLKWFRDLNRTEHGALPIATRDSRMRKVADRVVSTEHRAILS
jgi:ABC-type lipoprotein export system ATPase subunit